MRNLAEPFRWTAFSNLLRFSPFDVFLENPGCVDDGLLYFVAVGQNTHFGILRQHSECLDCDFQGLCPDFLILVYLVPPVGICVIGTSIVPREGFLYDWRLIMEKEGKAERENASKLRPSTKGHTMPIQKAVEIQKALKPLGYVVLGFEKEGLEFSLRLVFHES